MNLNEEQLKELETMSGLFFDVSEIMICLGIPVFMESEFTETIQFNNESPAFQAYHRGRITAEVELRESIKQTALNGSSPAQNIMLSFLNSTTS
jgi:hypothetical protein